MMTVNELINTCENIWKGELFEHNNELIFEIKSLNKNITLLKCTPWQLLDSKDYVMIVKDKEVLLWKINNINYIEITIP